MAYTWTTTADGCVLVNKGQGLTMPVLPKGRLRELANNVADRWAFLASEKADKYAVPLSWVLGSMFRESGGDPDAVSPAGAVGLMQIMPGIHGLSAEELRDPAVNVDKGAELLGQSLALGYDLPQALSRYNAGAQSSGAPHVSSLSPWGMRENEGHISAVVSAHNYYSCSATRPRLVPFLALAAAFGLAVAKGRGL